MIKNGDTEGGADNTGGRMTNDSAGGMTDGMKMVCCGTAAYPGRLNIIPDKPETLYYIGALPEDIPTVGIVGARLCSHYGRTQAFEFGRALASRGIQVVSGMAIGIDCYAQEGALSAGGRTFSVLGSGADVCYPKSNYTAYREIIRHGGVMSEEKPGTPPLARNFPKRNRMISALSDILIVVEAREKSGSLITVDFALEQGKTVFAVPGRVGDSLSDGCNYLIAQGAGIAYSPEAVLFELESLKRTKNSEKSTGNSEPCENEDLPVKKRRTDLPPVRKSVRNPEADPGLSKEARCLYKFISRDPMTLDGLLAASGLEPSEAAPALLELMMSDYIEEIARHSYVKK